MKPDPDEDITDEMDESLYEDDLDHEGHWFEIWGED